MEQINIIKKDILWQGRFIQGVRATYMNSAGKVKTWEYIERIHSHVVFMVLFDQIEQKFIVIEEGRIPVARKVIGLVAGVCDIAGEFQEAAAIREAIEEAGCDPKRVILLGENESISPGIVNELGTIFLGTEIKYVDKKDGEEENGIKVHFVSRDIIFAWLDHQQRSGKIIDIKVRGSIALALRVIEEEERTKNK
jgi:8-oxo-dGTP pyrophosphatase MutT (NUDIX family)